MDSVTLHWTPTNYRQLDSCADCYLYAVTFKKQLLYIGMAYSQSVQARLKHKQHIQAKYQHLMDEITVWLGEVNYASFSRISLQRIRDMEALLIFMHQPPDNTQSKMSYRGRPNLRVRSRNCPSLYGEIWVQEGVCYPAWARPI